MKIIASVQEEKRDLACGVLWSEIQTIFIQHNQTIFIQQNSTIFFSIVQVEIFILDDLSTIASYTVEPELMRLID